MYSLYCRVIFSNMGVLENVVYPKIVMLLGTIMINRMLLGEPPGTNLGPRQFPSPIFYVISGMLHEHDCHITVSTRGNKEEHTYLFVSLYIYINFYMYIYTCTLWIKMLLENMSNPLNHTSNAFSYVCTYH